MSALPRATLRLLLLWLAETVGTLTVRVARLDAAGRERVARACPGAYPSR